ncbi:MAG: tyrosine--tRNA ligase [bacterium]|nr:tyrosine--tRNA ligase [bacterium]
MKPLHKSTDQNLKNSKIITDKKRIDEIFNRGIVAEVLPSKEGLLKILMSGRRLKIYIGADPTSDALHLSHAKNYMFLEELRQLGHEVIVLVGDFTAKIGDPTGKSETRMQLTEERVKENVKSWLTQIKPLMDFEDKKNPPKVTYNSKWLARLSLNNVVSLSAQFTVQQMLERDMFQRRVEGGKPIYLHEFLYPIMQGYDSVALDVDVELCGTDQIFNALAGRTLLKRLKNKDKFVLALNLMENPKTGELMSKSKGAGVFLSSLPEEMYGSIMAQSDEMTEVLFINCTRVPILEIKEITALGPRKAKARVALEIVKKFYGEARAKRAEEVFVARFARKGSAAEAYEEKTFARGAYSLVNFVVGLGGASSKSEARRLVLGKAVELEHKIITDPNFSVEFQKESIIRIGKKKFFRIVPK